LRRGKKKKKYFTLTVYLSLLAAWGYLRLYVFPFEIIIPIIANKYPVIHESLQKDGNFLLFFMYMLVTLQVMHVLWYGLFIKMGLNFLSTGKTEDIQQVRDKTGNSNPLVVSSSPAEKVKASMILIFRPLLTLLSFFLVPLASHCLY